MSIKNRDDKIRTCDPRDPNTVRYQAALHPENLFILNCLMCYYTLGICAPPSWFCLIQAVFSLLIGWGPCYIPKICLYLVV